MLLKNHFYKLILFLTVLFYQSLYGSHYQGLDIYYDCLGGGLYKITIKTYRDCGSTVTIGEPGSASGLAIAFASGCGQPTLVNPWTEISSQEVTPICGGFLTKCTDPNASLNGVQEQIFEATYDFSGINCPVVFSANSCCRNASITNVTTPGSRYIYADVTINNSINPCNSSPRFSNLPIPYICLGQNFTFNQGAVDPDGDSLVYRIANCLGGTATANQPVAYVPPLTGATPIASNPPMTINPVTGDVSMNPNAIQTAIMCLFVDEYRKNASGVPVLIGTIERDIQVSVINCGGNVIPTVLGFPNYTNPIQTTYSLTDTACAAQPYSGIVQGFDQNPGQIITMNWNGGIVGADFQSIPGVNSSGLLTWANPIASPTPYSFVVTVADDYCPIGGFQQITCYLYVQGSSFQVVDTFTTNCNTAQFEAHPVGGTAPYVYSWSGDGNLDLNPFNNDSSLVHVYPGPGTYNYSVTITDANRCAFTQTGQVVITNSIILNAGNDSTVCSNVNYVIGNDSIPGYKYSWRPAIGLSDTTLAQPTFNFINAGVNPLSIVYTVVISDSTCSAVDFVDITVLPIPFATISGNTEICLGDSVTLTSSDGLNYLWNTGDTVKTIRVQINDTTTYTVTTTDLSGCSSLPGTITINAVPIPELATVNDTSICSGFTTPLEIINPQGVAIYNWYNSDTSSTIIFTGTTFTTPVLTATDTFYVQTVITPCTSSRKPVIVTIRPIPTAPTATADSICAGDSSDIIISTPITNATYDVYDAAVGGTLIGSGTTVNTSILNVSTTFYVEVIVNACTSSRTPVFVKVNPIPNTPTFTATPICAGQTGSLTVNNAQLGVSYSWFDSLNATTSFFTGITFNTPVLTDTITYFVEGTSLGCTSARVPATLIVKPLPIAVISGV